MNADHAYIDEGIALISMARDARRTFAEAGLERRQSLLATLLSNSTYKDGVVTATFRKPFDIIVESLPREALLKAGGGAKIAETAEWLPFVEAIRKSFRENARAIALLLSSYRLLERDSGLAKGSPQRSTPRRS